MKTIKFRDRFFFSCSSLFDILLLLGEDLGADAAVDG